MLFVTRVAYGGVGGLQIDFVYTHMDIYVDWVYGVWFRVVDSR